MFPLGNKRSSLIEIISSKGLILPPIAPTFAELGWMLSLVIITSQSGIESFVNEHFNILRLSLNLNARWFQG